MRAARIEKPYPPFGVAEGDQVLAQDLDADGRAIGLRQLLRQQHGHPEAAEEIAHRRARPGPREQLVVIGAEHRVTSSWQDFSCA